MRSIVPTACLPTDGTPVARLMFSPDGETLAVIGLPTRLELWHWPTGRLLREMYLNDIEEFPRGYTLPTVAFSPHGKSWLTMTVVIGVRPLMTPTIELATVCSANGKRAKGMA